jgi:hypothetical protein
MIHAASHSAAPRFHPRVDANFMVKLLVDGKAVLAKARDLSMAGLSLVGDFDHLGDKISLAIPLPNDREVRTHARIKRRGEEQLAVEFEPLDWDDMFALARYLHPRLP